MSSGGKSSNSTGAAGFSWVQGSKGQVKGVNLGGWLLLEPFITPSLFPKNDTVDEYTFCEKNKDAKSMLQKHWQSWITEKDFKEIHDIGFNMVRIGIGYWAFRKRDDDPYIRGAAEYLDKAIKWAGSLGLKVVVDLHGAPGSQNGFDNSGQATKNATWLQQSNVDLTLDVLRIIGKKYGNNPTVAGIGLLNEPFPEKLGYLEPSIAKVVEFHKNAYRKVRGASSPRTAVLISDAFVNAFKWNDEYQQTGPGANIIDHHDYQVFDDNLLPLDLDKHLEQVTLDIDASVANSTHPTTVGEWSGALTDCAKYLNGRNEGARYEGKFSASKGLNKTCSAGENDFKEFEKDETLRENTRKYLQKQADVFSNKSNGWFFWTFKTESAPPWDAQFLHKCGIFPALTGDGGNQTYVRRV
ncbi:MAG: hypothetical protein LQ342_002552 [Letrouitia transgressa]|nr:MAG: hypothetical protein LQ342_002552 [Letrouitia transgressa]